ncbi:MAG: hypothetical protein KDI36_19255, partial [Pseudomonadales bacterium]|nr:hypothetical protein [Pseudomonadales bacterium]
LIPLELASFFPESLGELTYQNDFSSNRSRSEINVGYYDTTVSQVAFDNKQLILAPNGRVSAYLFPAVSVRHAHIYLITIDAVAVPPVDDGLFLRVMASNHPTENSTDSVYLSPYPEIATLPTLRADQETVTSLENTGSLIGIETYSTCYKPEAQTESFSPLLMKWNGLKDSALYVRKIKIVELPAWAKLGCKFSGAMHYNTRDFDVSFGVRAAIWSRVVSQMVMNPLEWLIGKGFLNQPFIDIPDRNGFSDREEYKHPHQLILSLIWYGGLPALILFVAIILSAKRLISSSATLLGTGIAIFSLLSLSLDGGNIVSKVNQYWLLIWLPLGLLLSGHHQRKKIRANEH